MSNASEYLDLYASDFADDGIDYTYEILSTYVVLTRFYRSGGASHSYDEERLVSYPTLAEAEKAFAESLKEAADFVRYELDNKAPSWCQEQNFAEAHVSLCVGLDVLLRPVDSFGAADLAFSGETSDGLHAFEADLDDLRASITRDVNLLTEYHPDSDPELQVFWSCGEIEIPAE